MKKILTVIGARPQFIKASVVSHALRRNALQEVVVHTGQHFDANMSEVFFSDLGMSPPAHNLQIHGGLHGAMTGQMLIEVERVMVDEKPDAVLVYGDTNSTLAGALAAAKLHVPVAHVEAGLRSFNKAMPEEINRLLTDHMSTWLFTPTRTAEENLEREGIPASRVIPVGDVMYDVALHHGARVDENARFRASNAKRGEFVLVTVHRAENTDHGERLAVIVDALQRAAKDIAVVWPMHPRTRHILEKQGRFSSLGQQLQIIDPVGYLDMVALERAAALIVTDSGGVQKEAFFHRVPCVTLRDETEWVELVVSGWNRLAPPTSAESVAGAIRAAIGTRGADGMPYGDGKAAERIASFLASQ